MSIFRKRLSTAVDQRDHVTILRFVRLYPPLGLEEEGLRAYIGYLKKVVSMRSWLEFDQLVELMEQSYSSSSVGNQGQIFGPYGLHACTRCKHAHTDEYLHQLQPQEAEKQERLEMGDDGVKTVDDKLFDNTGNFGADYRKIEGDPQKKMAQKGPETSPTSLSWQEKAPLLLKKEQGMKLNELTEENGTPNGAMEPPPHDFIHATKQPNPPYSLDAHCDL
ncbi:hypothetical protein RJ639_027016 [Escallonia herrerae]|uniref:Uncharacterized protein n=1 Tax=Escallonia herrerae TaxID=1293975 RepID=A0AA89BEY2_9ASTE|nr:hypothetical protein RJ639_027016 [Escallonia herrerae]